MPVLTMPAKPAVRTLVPSAVSRGIGRIFGVIRRPLNLPGWIVVAAAAVLVFGAFLAGRRHPEHHYVAYFGYPMVLDTSTGKACYAASPRAAGRAKIDDPGFTLDGTANQFDAQQTAGDQIPLCPER